MYDGYGSHYDDEIIQKAISLKIILVLLPANATHLVQPLDVAIFKPFKTYLKRELESYMIKNAVTSLSKKEAIEIASTAWKGGIEPKKEYFVNGFKTCGIWPLSLPAMIRRLNLYQKGGINSSEVTVEPWLKCRETVRSKILLLPTPIDRSRKRRKTLDVSNRLLSRDDLNNLEQ